VAIVDGVEHIQHPAREGELSFSSHTQTDLDWCSLPPLALAFTVLSIFSPLALTGECHPAAQSS